MAKQDPKDEKHSTEPQPKNGPPEHPFPQQKPTIGRIVHFVLPGAAEPAAALVTGTYEDDSAKADLLVALPHGHPNGFLMSRPGVLLDDSETPAEHTWHWPARA